MNDLMTEGTLRDHFLEHRQDSEYCEKRQETHVNGD